MATSQNLRVISSPDTGRCGAEAAEIIIRKIEALLQEKTHVVLGWPGGRSPKPLIEQFVTHFVELQKDVRERVVFAQVDERLKRNDVREHNIVVLDELLFTPLFAASAIRPEQVLRYPLANQGSDDGVGAYTKSLAAYGGRFDIVILGAGEDGHIAGCFPEHPTSTSKMSELMAYEEAPKPPRGRVTATLPLLAQAQLGVLLFIGEGKRDALHRFFSPEVAMIACPAKVVLQMKEAVVVTDLPVPAQSS